MNYRCQMALPEPAIQAATWARELKPSLFKMPRTSASLVRTLLVPSTVALLGRRNWRPSAHGAPARLDNLRELRVEHAVACEEE
jgi:hypothetical protein